MILRAIKVGDVSDVFFVSSGTNKRKASSLRRVKRMKRLAELVSRMRQREYRSTILDPVEYDTQPVIHSVAHPSVLRMLRRQG